MSRTAEIYVYRSGQTVREGLVTLRPFAAWRQARADALRRLGADPSIEKIGYYTTDKTGYVKCLFNMDNPAPARMPVPIRAPVSNAAQRPAALARLAYAGSIKPRR